MGLSLLSHEVINSFRCSIATTFASYFPLRTSGTPQGLYLTKYVDPAATAMKTVVLLARSNRFRVNEFIYLAIQVGRIAVLLASFNG